MNQSCTFIEGEQLERIKIIFEKMKPFLVRKDELDFELFVIDAPCQNACAAPGGKIYVTLPLLENMTDDQVASILGHELGHLEQKHSYIQIKYMKIIGETPANILHALTQSLSQRNELEADLCGVYLAQKTGYNIDVATEAFLQWGKNEQHTFVDKILRSHPYCSERVSCINAYIAEAKKAGEGLKRIKH
jgi:predicted Zn-dependent protease